MSSEDTPQSWLERRFEARCTLPCSVEDAFAWHERTGAFERLNPPWEPVKILARSGGIRDGAEVTLAVPLGPVSITWKLRHQEYVKNSQFKDVQVSGPFASYAHTHRFHSTGPGACSLEDQISYRLPVAPFGEWFGGSLTRSKLARAFAYRHRITEGDIAAHQRYAHHPRLQVLVSGASGLVGSQLVPYLSTAGHSVKRLVRRSHPLSHDEISWEPGARVNFPSLTGIDAVVHLAGDGIANGRWTAAKKARIRDSRVSGTRSLCESLLALTPRPKVLICASGVGFYGDRGDEVLTEDSALGEGFLASVSKEWEEATHIAADAGTRVVHLRFGVVLNPAGGALKKMLLPFSLGLGGALGAGSQWMSWIGLDDVLGIIEHALCTETLHGAFNTVAPVPVTNHDFTKALGRVLGRPTFFTVPRLAADLAFGEMAKEALFTSIRASSEKIEKTGYKFRCRTIDEAFKCSLGL
jgi:uncharacterized protein (TIGR01777 family)